MNLSRNHFTTPIKQYTALIISFFIMTLGVSLSIRSNFGSSAISVWPYVWSMAREPIHLFGYAFTIPAWSLGEYTYCMNFLLVFVQVALLRRNFSKIQYFQLLLGFLFGAFLDITMWITTPLQWDSTIWGYTASFIQLLIGGAILGVGITCEVRCKALMMPGEGVSVALAKVLNRDFGKVKIATDTALVLTGVGFSYLFFGCWRWDLIGIGTLISMVYVGIIVRLVTPHSEWLSHYIFGEGSSVSEKDADIKTGIPNGGTTPLVITIARQFGSGGHEIGEKLAQQLNMDFVDYKLIEKAANNLGLPDDYIQAKEQRISNSKLIELILTDKQVPEEMITTKDDAIFIVQSRIIRQIAAEKPCVIIGRCADYVLKNRPNTFNIFIHSDFEYTAQRLSHDKTIDIDRAKQIIHQTNQERANHYWQYTNHKWGEAGNYDLILNTTHISIDRAVELITCAVKDFT